MSGELENSVEKQIREARERGDFDNLPGQGKPLKLGDDSLVPEEMRLAYRVMHNGGFAPEWIEIGQEIEKERASLEGELSRGARAERLERLRGLRERIEALNRAILDYNLRVPLPNLHKNA